MYRRVRLERIEVGSQGGADVVEMRRNKMYNVNDTTRGEIAECLDQLAAQTSWNEELWQRCYDLVKANWDDELVEYIYDDLVHYSGRPLLRSRSAYLQPYSQEFRNFAVALRSKMSLAEFKKQYE